MADRNVGTESMPKAVPVMKRSKGPPLRAAQTIASGTPIEIDSEQIDQQNGGQECRHRKHAEGGTGHEAVERTAAACRADDRERDTDRDRQRTDRSAEWRTGMSAPKACRRRYRS